MTRPNGKGENAVPDIQRTLQSDKADRGREKQIRFIYFLKFFFL